MLNRNQRFWLRLSAYAIANVAFYLIQQRYGWLLAFCLAGFLGAARGLAKADCAKTPEEINGLPK